jgi:iron complex outermembrane recepter protein
MHWVARKFVANYLTMLMASSVVCSTQAAERRDDTAAAVPTDSYQVEIRGHHSLVQSLNLARAPAKVHAEYLRQMFGYYADPGRAGDLLLGPLQGEFDGRAAWIELIKPHCPIIVKKEYMPGVAAGSVESHSAGDREIDFNIGRVSRLEAAREWAERAAEGIFASITDADSAQLVGPIQGRMTANQALQLILQSTELHGDWSDDGHAMHLWYVYKIKHLADMRVCPWNFGFAEWRPPPSEHVTVAKSRLPTLEELVETPVFVGDRRWIDSTGASSVPELFRFIPQFAFIRPPNYRVSGAQFFEGGRGFGPEYTLVLVNGRRTFGSAAEPITTAFDLNSIPLPAVDRIEITFDQPSVAHGTDAIGGTVNIVLKHDHDDVTADAWAASASGGAKQRRGTLSGGYQWGSVHGGVVIDYFDIEELLGSERERWRDQDFTRYGSSDQRSRFAGPPNVRAIAGNLPGLNSQTAAIVPSENGAVADAGSENRTSLRSFQSVVPANERTTLYGYANADIGKDLFIRTEALLGRRTIRYQLFPTFVPGFVWGANHPENPFKQDVLIETALTGFPIQTYEGQSDLLRGVVEAAGSIEDWSYSVFGLVHQEHSQGGIVNVTDPLAIIRSLSASDDDALHVATHRPGEGVDPSAYMATPRIDRLASSAELFGASFSGPLMTWAGREVATEIGVEHRQEKVRFDPRIGAMSRSVDSAFADLRVPVVENVALSVGMRRDFYSDLDSVTRPTYGITWKLTPKLSIAASASKLFRPPSLYELHRPRLENPTQIFDPLRNELAPVMFIVGGNEDLRPTEGRSANLGIMWQGSNQLRMSTNVWQIEMKNRVSLPMAPALLRATGELAGERVGREDPTRQDQIDGRPGRLISIDARHANFGRARTSGVDISIEKQLNVLMGMFGARLDLTHVFSFDDSNLPVDDAPLYDRAGRLAPEGTVPTDRAVLSVNYSRASWRGTIFARYYSSLDEYVTATGTFTGRKISARPLVDASLSRMFAEKVEVTLGANNVLNDQPPFADGFDDVGYDLSQGDLTGRTVFLKFCASF